MFTKNQFTYLARVQWLDDWHASYFTTIVRQCHESDVDEFATSVRLEQAEFDEMMTILSHADQEDIWHLQAALNELAQIDYRLFEQNSRTANH